MLESVAVQLAANDDQAIAVGWALMIGGAVVVAGLIALFVAAAVSIIRSSRYDSGIKALWVLAILAFPFVGPVLWFVVGRGTSGVGEAVSSGSPAVHR